MAWMKLNGEKSTGTAGGSQVTAKAQSVRRHWQPMAYSGGREQEGIEQATDIKENAKQPERCQ